MVLRSLSDSEILSRLQRLVQQERDVTLLVLVHLNEIERRRLHLKLGYSSLFEYCTSKLGYSASAAARRIRTVRCVARFPRVYELLQKNEVNLSTVAQVSGVLTQENHEDLISRIRGKSQREVEAILAEYQPCTMPRERVRTIVVRVPAPRAEDPPAQKAGVCAPTTSVTAPAAGEEPSSASASACEKSAYCRNGSAHDTRAGGPACPERSGGAEKLEHRALVQFSASEAFMAKLDKIRSLVWHQLPANASLEQVFELMMDFVIEKKDPSKSVERRNRRLENKARKESEAHKESEANKESGQLTPRSRLTRRQIPARVRDHVFKRDGDRCTFVGAGGRRCSATRALQVDHIRPVARGGPSTPDNLRLLCAYHNRLEAERLLGSFDARSSLRL